MILFLTSLFIFCNSCSASPVNVAKIGSPPSDNSVLRITEELPSVSSQSQITESRSLTDEFVDVLTQLVAVSHSDITPRMQNDQADSDLVTNFNISQIPSEKRQEFEDSQFEHLLGLLGNIRKMVDHPDAPLPNNTRIPKTGFPLISTSDSLAKTEFLKPTCKEKLQMSGGSFFNNSQLYLYFEFDMPNVTLGPNMTLKIESVTLCMKKYAVSMNDFNDSYSNSDDPNTIEELQNVESSLNKTYQKLNVHPSNRVLESQALYSIAQEKTIRVNIYKIKKNKTTSVESLYLLSSASIPALEERDTSWNITQAIKGHNARKKLDLVVEVEDEKSRKLPVSKFFKLKCDVKYKGKPTLLSSSDVSSKNFVRDWKQPIWLELSTREVNFRIDTINQVTSTLNHNIVTERRKLGSNNDTKVRNHNIHQTEDTDNPPA